jgi:hypothetical protein
MYKTTKITKLLLIGLLSSFVLYSQVQGQGAVKASSDEQLLKVVPATSLFCLRINDMNNTLNKIDQFLAGPSPVGISTFVQMQIANLLGDQQPANINTKGSFALFVTASSSATEQDDPLSNIFFGVLAPVTDYAKFLSGNTNFSQPDIKGISKITINDTTDTIMTPVGNYVLLCPANEYDKLVLMKAQLTSTGATGLDSVLAAPDLKQSSTEPIWLYVNMQQISKTYAPQVKAAMEQIKQLTATMDQNPALTPGNISNIMAIYTDIIDALMNQTKALSIGINPESEVLRITGTTSTIPQTDMAKLFSAAASTSQNDKLLSYLENGAAANYQINMNSPLLKQLNLAGIDIISELSGGSVKAETQQKMNTLVNDITACLDGPVVYSMSLQPDGKPVFALKYAATVKDADKFRKLIPQAIELVNSGGIFDFYKNMGIEMKFEAAKKPSIYKNVSIDSAKLTIKPTQAEESRLDDVQVQMLDSMYGDGIEYKWAIVNGVFLCSAAGSSEVMIHELIDKAQSSSNTIGSEINKAISLLPGAKQADFFVTFNMLRIIQVASAMIPFMSLPDMPIQTSSNIAVTGKAADGRLVVNIALPKEHIQEIITAVLAAQQEIIQQLQR